MGILFTTHMGFLFTITMGILFTIVLGIQFTISTSIRHPPLSKVRSVARRCECPRKEQGVLLLLVSWQVQVRGV